MEGDLAFRQIDLRDLYRPGSGLTPRRLKALIVALPPEASVWAAMTAAEEKAKVPDAVRIRERQAYWAAKGN